MSAASLSGNQKAVPVATVRATIYDARGNAGAATGLTFQMFGGIGPTGQHLILSLKAGRYRIDEGAPIGFAPLRRIIEARLE